MSVPFDVNLYLASLHQLRGGERPAVGAVGAVVRYLERTPSTMDDARAGAAAGGAPGTVYVAGAQSAGRGRHGRDWLSTASVGLYATYHLRTSSLEGMPLYSLAGGLAASDAVLAASGLATVLKWPNDVQHVAADGSARKLGGVLAESRITPGHAEADVFLGVGINVRAVPLPPELEARATSIEASGCPPPALEVLLASLSHALSSWTALLDASPSALIEAWRARLVTIGQRVRLATPAGPVEGLAVDVTPRGELVLRHDDGRTVAYAAGDVTTLPSGGSEGLRGA
ncbi:MAG: biotin--[acetyl-CoA-carboxylase] ligase [Dehalococcoidia bacterium]|nr:biotin--[acetyl-CoA-carboxylase] ligase [Dehalococcoidia bacterium]